MTAWLSALLLSVAVGAVPETAASPVPVPNPSPAASALPEIGRVRANAACQAIIDHARVAITSTVHNDRRLLSLATVMDRVSPNAIVGEKKVRAVDVLAQWASSIESDVAEAQGAIDRLRALAAASTDETRKRELKAFADALSGAVARQKFAAHEVQRGLFLIGARADVADARAIEDDPALGIKGAVKSLDGTSLRTPQDSPKLRDIAATLAERIKLIKEDEHEGVRHEVGATSGC
ncbi:MAG: hypothetical protein M3169_00145 [Candidatus Eremiobacteraeota bacterium]|nr:hypothetical protein [Candidatus Eremiobacteraeota bacterium]